MRRRAPRRVKLDPDLRLSMAGDVYAPSDDSCLLLAAVEVAPGDRVLEVGTGTGFIALHAASVGRVVATDVSPEAVRLARANAIANRRTLAPVRCDLLRGLRGAFDVIVFNPPYLIDRIGGDWVERAWQGGVTGDEVIARFLEQAPPHLAPAGRIYLLVPERREHALALAKERFRVRVVAERRLFFERLLVLELTHPR